MVNHLFQYSTRASVSLSFDTEGLGYDEGSVLDQGDRENCCLLMCFVTIVLTQEPQQLQCLGIRLNCYISS